MNIAGLGSIMLWNFDEKAAINPVLRRSRLRSKAHRLLLKLRVHRLVIYRLNPSKWMLGKGWVRYRSRQDTFSLSRKLL